MGWSWFCFYLVTNQLSLPPATPPPTPGEPSDNLPKSFLFLHLTMLLQRGKGKTIYSNTFRCWISFTVRLWHTNIHKFTTCEVRLYSLYCAFNIKFLLVMIFLQNVILHEQYGALESSRYKNEDKKGTILSCTQRLSIQPPYGCCFSWNVKPQTPLPVDGLLSCPTDCAFPLIVQI